MIDIAIVEDSDREASSLSACLTRYAQEHRVEFNCERYRDANAFLSEREKTFDIVFMDIMLPGITGMEAAERLRKYNGKVVLIFVTNMVQFAIKSYEVDALDYIMKPVSYERVSLKLHRAIETVRSWEGKMLVVNNNADGVMQIFSNDVLYIEVRGHKLAYHTSRGVFCEWGSLSDLEEELRPYHFMRCNACYLVNPMHIRSAKGMTVELLNGEELKISQLKRKSFMNDFTNWLGQGKC